MKSCLRFFSIAILVSSCATKAVPYREASSKRPTKIIIPLSYDVAWDRAINFFYDMGCNIKSKNKTDGTMFIHMDNGPLGWMDKHGKISDTAALAFTELRKKRSNYLFVYPQKGKFEWDIVFIKGSETSTTSYITFKDIGAITTFKDHGFLVNKEIKNVKIWSTGVIEKRFLESIR